MVLKCQGLDLIPLALGFIPSLVYTEEGENYFLPHEGKKILSRLVNSNKIYVLFVVMFEWY